MDSLVDVGVKVDFDFTGFENIMNTAVQRGINRGLERSRAEADRRMKKQNSLVPKGAYHVIKASIHKLSGTMELSVAGSNLMKYVLNPPSPSGGVKDKAVRVRVKPGSVVTMKNMFFMMRKGEYTLAMRLKPGQRVPGKKKDRFARADGLVVGFSGPSADQLFIPGFAPHDAGVAAEMASWTADVAIQETFRQIDLLTKKK